MAKRICKIIIVLLLVVCCGLGAVSLFFGKNDGGTDLVIGAVLLLVPPLAAGFLFSEELRGMARLKRLAVITLVGVVFECAVGLMLHLAGM